MSTPQETLKSQLNYVNVLEWWNNGIDGKGVLIWNGEENGGHGGLTRSVIEQVAPGAEVISASNGYRTDGNKLIDGAVFVNYKGERMTMDEFLTRHKPHILSQSQKGSRPALEFVEYAKAMVKKHNLKIFNSAGNEGDLQEIWTHWPIETCMAIGALNYMNGKYPVRAGYSCTGEDLDFMQFTSFHSGTSFSCPFVAAMTAMIYQRYGVMGFDETYLYLKMISNDLGELHHDPYYGHGQPILPKFCKKYITMTTTSNNYQIDGEIYCMDTRPINKDGNVFVPIRVISEALGGDVAWEFNADKSIKILIQKGTTLIVLNTGQEIALVNGTKTILNFAPYINEENRTMVPIRFISEALNCKVDWVQSEGKVMILEQ